jgi:hypothetical protein
MFVVLVLVVVLELITHGLPSSHAETQMTHKIINDKIIIQQNDLLG